jgi:heptosyltransferase-2
MALPVLGCLAASGRKVVALAPRSLHPLLRLMPAVSDMVEKTASQRETIASLRRLDCAEAVVLPNSFRSAWLPYRAAIPRRWGYRGNLRSPFLHPAVAGPPRRGLHQSEDYGKLLEAMGVAPPSDWTPHLEVTPELARRGGELLARAGVRQGDGPLIGLFPGAEFGPSKRWPWQRFAALAREMRKRLPTIRCVILAGPRELWLAVRIYEETAKLHPVVGPDLDLADLAAALSRLDILVTNDSGPMHLAAALGVRCLALFGPTDPARTRPAGEDHRVLYTDRWCSPCFRRRCPLLHHRCLRAIDVEQVADEAGRLITRSPAGDPRPPPPDPD